MYKGQTIAFTVDLDNLMSTIEYDVKANVYAGENGTQSATNSDLGFNSGCSEATKTVDVPAGSTSHSASFTLHVCDSEYDGGVVTITLIDASDTIVTGDWFSLEARQITVAITSNNPFPVTGDTVAGGGPDTVTLTAVIDAPAGTTFGYFKWLTQEPEHGKCPANIIGTSSTHTRDSTTATTKTIWVIAKENNDENTPCYTSNPVYVTWNLGSTLSEITDALAANFVTPTTSPTPEPGNNGDSGATARATILPAHQRALLDAESSLLTCAGITDGSFAALMTQYTGATKTLLDSGACSIQANDMWTALEASFSTTLTTIRTTGTNATAINAFLASEPGQSLVTYMTDSDQLKGSIENFIVSRGRHPCERT